MSENEKLYDAIKNILQNARRQTYSAINYAMVQSYWHIGRLIVEDEQKGKARAEYGKQTLINLSEKLTAEFGKGFSVENLDRMRFFYKTYPDLLLPEDTSNSSTLLTNSKHLLSWSHYIFLMRIDDENERRFYETETFSSSWSLRELKRQFDSSLYERTALSKDKLSAKQLPQKGIVLEKPSDAVKDPYVLEFLGLPEKSSYSESELESRIIDKLEMFLLELGKGFAFIGRQVRLTFDEKHFFVDLVFYNRILQCFVLIDLKIGELTHQDIGQMQMYVNYYDRNVCLPHENKTIGILLCKKKDDSLVEMTLPQDNDQIFASRYQTVLPDKEVLKKLLQEKEDEK